MRRSLAIRSIGMIVSVVTISGVIIDAPAAAVPQSLVGTWGKSLSAADFKKGHVVGEPGGHYALVIAPSGLVSMYKGNDPTMASVTIPFTTMRAHVSGNTVTFGSTADGVCAGNGTYHWTVSGSKLHLTLVKEGCDQRQVLMTSGAFALEH
jgi:hypothetical protein